MTNSERARDGRDRDLWRPYFSAPFFVSRANLRMESAAGGHAVPESAGFSGVCPLSDPGDREGGVGRGAARPVAAKAAWAVARLALSPRRRPDPVLVEFDSGLPGTVQNVLLANAITLTPGTITVSQKNGHFVIHCLRPEYGEGLSDCSFVRILRKMKGI